LPTYSLIVFGCYALWTIGAALWNFGDCDEAAVELKKVGGESCGAGVCVWLSTEASALVAALGISSCSTPAT
jgi:hypothetical protein